MQEFYQTPNEILVDAAQLLLPPERITVSQAAEKYRYISNPGSYIGPWKNETTPYLVEVMDVLASRHYQNCIYVKPAQSGGTEVDLNFMLYSAVVDPADLHFFEASETKTREFGKDKLAKMVRHCPDLSEALLPGKAGQQAHALRLRSGTRIKLSWPSINELSGHSTGRLILTDYDRWDENIGGEGGGFELAEKRATSFKSFAMTLAESSPGRPMKDPKWRVPKETPHMGPPCTGIVSLYNGGDRRRWYWPCPHCGTFYEPCFDVMWWPSEETDIAAAAEQAEITCRNCGLNATEDHKFDLNLGAHWIRERDFLALHDGKPFITKESIKANPKAWEIAVHKPEAYNTRASFWSKGPIAAFLSWRDLVHKYLRAKQTYDTTGDYQAWKTTTNTDQCLVFKIPGNESDRNPDELQDRAVDLGELVVPELVWLLLASIDVQKRRFVVQVQGVGPGGDITVIDRFDIVKSNRVDEDGDRLGIEPASYLEDWDAIEEQVLDKTYPLDDGSGRRMIIKATVCDSGGSASTIGRNAGVTEKAYKYYRKLKKKGKHKRFHLIKGGGKTGPRVQLVRPDAERKDRHAGARGEIPVLLINPNIIKDALDGMLDRTEKCGGMVHFPDHLPNDFYEELCSEIRDPVKGWIKVRSRNESWDLLVYCLTLMIYLKIENMDWDKPYRWAAPWDLNTLVTGGEGKPKLQKKKFDMAEFAKNNG